MNIIQTPPRNALIRHIFDKNGDREVLRDVLQRVQAAQTAGA